MLEPANVQLLSSASPPSKALRDGFSSRTLSHCDVAHWVGPWWGYSGAERGRIQLYSLWLYVVISLSPGW